MDDIDVTDRSLIWNTDLVETLELDNLIAQAVRDDALRRQPQGKPRRPRARGLSRPRRRELDEAHASPGSTAGAARAAARIDYRPVHEYTLTDEISTSSRRRGCTEAAHAGAMSRVLVLGGYGNFGGYISRRLAADPSIQLLIGGRSKVRADAFAAGLGAANAPETFAVDRDGDLAAVLAAARPDLVIHTVGPFQGQDYRVAEACIALGVHYLDLADGRAFVGRIHTLDAQARAANVAVISGASSVPCLSAAIVDHYRPLFAELTALDYGITAAQQTNRGVATAAAILSYVGKPFRTMRGDANPAAVYGWQDLHVQTYPELGPRLFGNCNIPDLGLFPARYPGLEWIRFGAGHELATLNLGTWVLSWLVRWGLVPSLDRWASPLLEFSRLFGWMGSDRSGMHVLMSGTGHDGAPKQIRFFLIARSGHGPNIPCIPAVLLAQRLARGEHLEAGARPCLDLIDLDAYRAAMQDLDVSIHVEGADA